ncbi:unnamed protein product [Linum tenue]|uniref:MADS-box domain-containing protein n=1 Tax=Linum tenue TaxID=586396 RepID=A0AAV0RBC9_9ROSI|nr:unnamed protein product [Linum tenue]
MDEEKKKATKRIDDDVTRRRATSFSKRSRSLLRKAHKISAFCDAEVALVAFSPSGLATKFSSGERYPSQKKKKNGR